MGRGGGSRGSGVRIGGNNGGSSRGSSGGSGGNTRQTTIIHTTTPKSESSGLHPLLILFLVLVVIGLFIGAMIAYNNYQPKKNFQNNELMTNNTSKVSY